MQALFEVFFLGHEIYDETLNLVWIHFNLRVGKIENKLRILWNKEEKDFHYFECFANREGIICAAYERIEEIIKSLEECKHLFKKYPSPVQALIFDELKQNLANYEIWYFFNLNVDYIQN